MPDSKPPVSSAKDPSSTLTSLTLAAIAPIARSSVVDAVADRLRNEILSGRIAAGSKLPSERELSLALGVNRLTLRASLARLEALGLIATRHGAGTVVASWRESAGLDTLGTLVGSLSPSDPTWFEIVVSALEVRRILASEAVALAASRHTETELAAIARAADDVKNHTHDPLAYARADLAFMRAIVRAARNVGLELLLNTFARWPDESPRLVESLYDHGGVYVGLYEMLVAIIKSGDADAARTVIRRALEEMDSAWARRHAPPKPAVEPPATGAAPAKKKSSKKESKR